VPCLDFLTLSLFHFFTVVGSTLEKHSEVANVTQIRHQEFLSVNGREFVTWISPVTDRINSCKIRHILVHHCPCGLHYKTVTTKRNTCNDLVTYHLGIPTVWQSFVGQPVPWPGVTVTQTVLWLGPTLIYTAPSLTVKIILSL
jgi:hypothetical protein